MMERFTQLDLTNPPIETTEQIVEKVRNDPNA
jgi:hypothetical protein